MWGNRAFLGGRKKLVGIADRIHLASVAQVVSSWAAGAFGLCVMGGCV